MRDDRDVPAGEKTHRASQRLAAITDDPALMRRQLIDGGFLSRRRDGSAYSLAV